jgi:ATP-dependent Zn protease
MNIMNNTVLMTTLILGMSGYIMMNIKQVFNFFADHFINIFCYSLKVEESSKFYYAIQKFVMKEKNNKIHNFYYKNIYDNFIDGENDDTNLFYNYGYLIFKHAGRRMLIYKINETLQNSMTPYKNIKQTIKVYSFSKKSLNSFVEYIINTYEKNKLHYYFNDNGEIRILGKVMNKTFDNIFLNDDLNQFIRNDIDTFEVSENRYYNLGLKYKRTYLFYGLAGTGKSSLSVAIANYTKRNILSINISKDMTDSTLIKLISTREKRSIILFEDIDCLFDNLERKNGTDEENKNSVKITLSCLLNILDGSYTPNDVIFILTTNHVEKLDPALRRDGRIDVSLEITKPNIETKMRYVSFIKKFKNDQTIEVNVENDVTLSTLQQELLK